MNNNKIVESLVYLQGEEGLNPEQVQKVFDLDNEQEAIKMLNDFKTWYNDLQLGTKVFEFNHVYKIATREMMKPYITKLVTLVKAQKLSTAAIETIGIIAYKQPITRSSVAEIRGVSSDQVIHTLLAKGLVEEVGVAATPGNPILYGITYKFYDYFKIKSLQDLPKLDEFEFLDSTIDDEESNTQTFNLYASQREE